MIYLLYTIIFKPALWLLYTVLTQFLILLTLMIIYRTFKTLLILWLPEDNWFRKRQLQPVSAKHLVLITGATSGIGLALAKYLHKLGYSLAATYYDSNEVGFNELKQLAKQSNRMHLLELDVRKQESITAAYLRVEELLKQHNLELFALINNAGLGSLQPFAWLQRKSISNLIETNLMGNLLMTREFLPLLAQKPPTDSSSSRPANNKRIIFVSSGLGLVPGATYATYGITKAAQIYLVKCLNLELKRRYGLQSVAVIPHNFIKNTNICFLNVKNNQNAWDELKPLERNLYQEDFKKQCDLTKSLEEATRAYLANNSSKSESRSNNKMQHNKSLIEKIIDFFRKVVASLNGENVAPSIEKSGALQSFELALRLSDPPELIFAGDNIFQLLIGSLLLVLPSSLSGLLSDSVAPNLYK